MDQEGQPREDRAIDSPHEGVAADASTRVAEILSEAERYAEELLADAAREIAASATAAQEEAERLVEDSRSAAREAARERADHLAAIQAALAARGPAVLEGLEGSGLTRARLEALRDALAAAADEVLAEAEADLTDGARADDEPSADTVEGDAPASDDAAPAEEPAPTDIVEPEPPAEEELAPTDAFVDEPLSEELARADAVKEEPPSDELAPADIVEEGDGAGDRETVDEAPAIDGEAVEVAVDADGNGDGAVVVEPQRFDGELPEGAPLARKPVRSRDRDARFAALLMALQGRDRGDVEAHLRSKFDLRDCAGILDEVFGRADARA